ncbi:ankyrin repeat-containing protein [Cavenderia fasciculata]|uniref:non-specific serine/threonine protein kinase n=1 Tax=Cavenderia fasciculata TaxID=261658 RepID=F4PJM3_CACFS|nr:ankyrin repeat-containing protein [Cavenderia fasciculata]EGG23797.1 ankyrin repeat-containing protein [Cavenderia fasciculata]|eukprot:XP_004361648.1 ankyrin repeat-containing protein [Cavenderia fasciculata]
MMSSSGQTELGQATSTKDMEKVKKLYKDKKKFAKMLTTFDQHGQTPMTNALKNNQEEMSPLHYAVHLGRDDLVNTLLKAGADLDIVGRDKKTPYELACESHKEIANRMLRYKELYEWLKEQGLQDYKEYFVKEQIFKDLLGDINEKILEKMGITTAGQKIRILKACAPFKSEVPIAIQPSPTISRKDVLDEDDLPSPHTPDIVGLRDSLIAMKHIGEINIINDNELEYTEKLGAGSSGKVYRGLYKGKEVAIKILKSMSEAKEVDEFKKEFQIMSAIRSKYVVNFYGAVLTPRLCMVMENCGRGSLYHVMNNEKYDIGWDSTFRFAIETARGIECLHKWNPQIVHRDLKSLNLLVNDKWEVKVCDFGLSRFNTGSNMETLTKMRGTFAYCAPEVYFGEQFSVKSDVYSIGMILWELVTRCINCRYERPFSEFKNLQHDFQIIIQTAKRGLRPTIPPACPANFAALINNCWDAKFENRPTCTDIVSALQTLETEYKSNKDLWEKAIKPLPIKPNGDDDD